MFVRVGFFCSSRVQEGGSGISVPCWRSWSVRWVAWSGRQKPKADVRELWIKCVIRNKFHSGCLLPPPRGKIQEKSGAPSTQPALQADLVRKYWVLLGSSATRVFRVFYKCNENNWSAGRQISRAKCRQFRINAAWVCLYAEPIPLGRGPEAAKFPGSVRRE